MKTIDEIFSSKHYRYIDRNSPVPLYYQISEAISQLIKGKRLQPNTQIPSEEKLSHIFQVSKMTVRQALAKLVSDGILTRRQGSGTFVAQKKIERKATKIITFYEDLEQKGLITTSKVLEKKIIQATDHLSERLKLQADERILKITRLRFVNEIPIAINVAYLPEKFCPNLINAELGDVSLFRFLEEKYDLQVVYTHQNIQAVKATSYESALLKIHDGDPLLLMERFMYNRQEVLVSYYVSFLRGDKYAFSSTLYR